MSNTLYFPHWNPVHRSAKDAVLFAQWNPLFIKIIVDGDAIPYLEDVPAGAKIIVRHYPLSENYGHRGFIGGTPEQLAARDAATCKMLADKAAAKGISKDRLFFEGLNEPEVWGREQPQQLAKYYRAFVLELHKYGLHAVVGNFGVGWPANTGKDTPVDWKFFQPVFDVMDANDYLGLHEYFGEKGAGENWTWWAGRYTQCPFKGNILLTECGIDMGVYGESRAKQGWMNLSGYSSLDQKAARYIGDLFWFEDKMRLDPRIKGAAIYTWDGNRDDWGMFSIETEAFYKPFLAALATRPPVVFGNPTPTPAPKTLEARLRDAFGPLFADRRKDLLVSATLKYQTRPLAGIDKFIVHHGGTVVTTADNMARYHVNSNKWPGIGYHFVISPGGKVEYVGDVNESHYHAGDANWTSIGACMNGDYSKVNAPAEMLESLEVLERVLEDFLGKPLKRIGHRDAMPGHTVCPGDHLYAQLFGSQPAPQPQPQPQPADNGLDAAYKAQGVPLNRDTAIFKAAEREKLGAPLTGEYETDGYIQQNFALGYVRVKKGAWDKVEVIEW